MSFAATFLTATMALLAAGCATPGPLHVYSAADARPTAILDAGGEGGRVDIPAFLEPTDELTGLAYDPFTDHLFLRLAPGNRILVVDRPARAVKRAFVVHALPDGPGGDLAVRPRNGHIFLLLPGEPALLELTRLGERVQTLRLVPTPLPPTGIAYDPIQDRLLVLSPASPARIAAYDLDGREQGTITLDREVGASLAFDSERREYYVPMAGSGSPIGVFDQHGRWQRNLEGAAGFVDLGPRSFLRLF